LNEDPLESFAFFEESMELSRRFRAMKLWLSLRYHGMGAFREAIMNDLNLAQHLAKRISSEPGLDLLAPVTLSAVCFRFNQAPSEQLNQLNAAILKRVIQRGRVFISNATLNGKFALRACIVNQRATESDVEEVVTETLAAAGEI
jgi:glutamate/tyrosine decarboxylase-like PLP-dependent enzyme